MNFILDENVPVSVRAVLEAAGHTVQLILEYVPPGAEDEIVATVSEQLGRVLISFDGDFERIAPRIPKEARQRFRRLSRVWLRCPEYKSAARLKVALSLIEAEHLLAQNSRDARMNIWISAGYIKTVR